MCFVLWYHLSGLCSFPWALFVILLQNLDYDQRNSICCDALFIKNKNYELFKTCKQVSAACACTCMCISVWVYNVECECAFYECTVYMLCKASAEMSYYTVRCSDHIWMLSNMILKEFVNMALPLHVQRNTMMLP